MSSRLAHTRAARPPLTYSVKPQPHCLPSRARLLILMPSSATFHQGSSKCEQFRTRATPIARFFHGHSTGDLSKETSEKSILFAAARDGRVGLTPQRYAGQWTRRYQTGAPGTAQIPSEDSRNSTSGADERADEPLGIGRGEGIPPPLKGIRVLDLTRVLAGPTATMLLADLGADVIKVEEPTRGDDTRTWYPPAAPLKPNKNELPSRSEHLPPESAYFLSVNRNKRSITVNFKDPEGLEIIKQLVKTSDVLVENFIAGKLAKMGLGWEDCKKINPKLIYVSITGYGQTGPYREAAGYDVIIEAEAGLMHITGEPDGQPCKVGVAATDIATGLYAHGAIMAALLSRQKTGKGVWVDCNLFETQRTTEGNRYIRPYLMKSLGANACHRVYIYGVHTISILIAGLVNIASNYLIAEQEASRHGTAHPSIVPYQVFPCGGGEFLMIGAGNNKQFKTLAEQILDRPELVIDMKFSTNEARVANRTELVRLITSELMKHNREHWLKRFHGLGIPFGPINNIRQTFEHPQAVARQVTVEIDHARAGKIKLVGPPVSYNGRKMSVRMAPPWLSEHTDEVLRSLGYSAEAVAGLRGRGVV